MSPATKKARQVRTAAKTVRRPQKTAGKTTPAKRVPKHGHGALYSGGVPGNKGGTGRPPNWFREFCRDVLADPKVQENVKAQLRARKNPGFGGVLKTIAGYAYGKPEQVHRHEGSVSHIIELDA